MHRERSGKMYFKLIIEAASEKGGAEGVVKKDLKSTLLEPLPQVLQACPRPCWDGIPNPGAKAMLHCWHLGWKF